jgi:hypothetical protein
MSLYSPTPSEVPQVVANIHRLWQLLQPLGTQAMVGRPFGEGHDLEEAVRCAEAVFQNPQKRREAGTTLAAGILAANIRPDDLSDVMGSSRTRLAHAGLLNTPFENALQSLTGAAGTFLGSLDQPGEPMWDLWCGNDEVASEFMAWHAVASLRLAALGLYGPMDFSKASFIAPDTAPARPLVPQTPTAAHQSTQTSGSSNRPDRRPVGRDTLLRAVDAIVQSSNNYETWVAGKDLLLLGFDYGQVDPHDTVVQPWEWMAREANDALSQNDLFAASFISLMSALWHTVYMYNVRQRVASLWDAPVGIVRQIAQIGLDATRELAGTTVITSDATGQFDVANLRERCKSLMVQYEPVRLPTIESLWDELLIHANDHECTKEQRRGTSVSLAELVSLVKSCEPIFMVRPEGLTPADLTHIERRYFTPQFEQRVTAIGLRTSSNGLEPIRPGDPEADHATLYATRMLLEPFWREDEPSRRSGAVIAAIACLRTPGFRTSVNLP